MAGDLLDGAQQLAFSVDGSHAYFLGRRVKDQQLNALKSEFESALDDKRAAVEATRAPAGAVDVTLASRAIPVGRVQPHVEGAVEQPYVLDYALSPYTLGE